MEQLNDTDNTQYPKSDNKINRLYIAALTIMNFISFFIFLLIIIYIGLEVIALKPQIWNLIKSLFNHNTANFATKSADASGIILKLIELLFLSSIPILVTSSFYKYYKSVLKNIFIPKDKQEGTMMIDILKSSVDVSMTKDSFFSILTSTGFIILLRRFDGSEGLNNNEILLYCMLLIGIIVLLFFTLKIKHTITATILKIIKEERVVKELEKKSSLDDSLEEHKKNSLDKINKEIKILQEKKSQLETSITQLFHKQSNLLKRDDNEISGLA